MAEKKQEDILIEETPQEEAPLTGRGAFEKRYRDANPDFEGDLDDDTLFDYAGSAFTERDELQGRYDSLNGANEKLAQIIGEDPRFAQFIAMVASGENLWYALGSTFGDVLDSLDEESLSELREGQEDYKSRYAKMKESFSTFEGKLAKYGEEKGLSEEDVSKIKESILNLAEMFNSGDFDNETFDLVYKGIDYDTERDAEINAAEIAGRNAAIVDMKNKKSEGRMPDMGGHKTSPKVETPPPFEEEPEDYFNSLTRK